MASEAALKPAPYLFDEIFAFDVEPLRPPAPGIDEATHEAAVERARAEGHAAGLAEGRRAAAESIAADTARAAERLVAEIATLAQAATDTHRRLHDEAVGLALAAAERLAATLIAAAPRAGIEQMLRDSLSDLRDVPHVVVRVGADAADDLRGRISGLAAETGFQGRIVVLADPEIGPGDGRIDWADGGVVRDSEAVRRSIEESARAYLAARSGPQAEDLGHE